MIKCAMLLAALFALMPAGIARADAPASGVFTATSACPALSSIRKGSNPGGVALAPAHASLRNPRAEERLQEALSAELGEGVKLQFTVVPPPTETPAALQERTAQARLRAAEEAIARDGHVKTLQEMFGARVVPDSVRPVD